MKMLLTHAFLALCLLCSVMGNAQASDIEFIEFKDAEVKDAVRMLSSITGANIAVTREAGTARVNLMLQDTRLRHAIDMVARVSGLWYRFNKANNSYLLMTEAQYQGDIVIYRDDIIRTFTLRHQNVKATAQTIRSLFGPRVHLSLQEEKDDFEGLPYESAGEATTVQSRTEVVSTAVQQSGELGLEAYEGADTLDGEKLTAGEMRQLGVSEVLDAEKLRDALGTSTPIFIATNAMHNLMFVRTSDENAMAEIEQIVEESDRPTPQVLLEMKIVRIDVGGSYRKDFDLSFNDAINVDGVNYQGANPTANTIDLDDTLLGSGSSTNSGTDNSNGADTDSSNGDMGFKDIVTIASQIRDNDVTGFGFAATGGFYEYFSRYVNARIELLEKNNQAEVIARPVILSSNNRAARLFIGEEQIVATGLETDTEFSGSNQNGDRESATVSTLETERRKVGNTLVLLPSINADRTVTIDILQDSSTIRRGGLRFPVFDSTTGSINTFELDAVEEANVKTVVVAKDGQTVALGGMIRESRGDSRSAVPVLGDLPLIGEMFTSESTDDSRYQYIMLLTPHILMSPDESVAKSRAIEELDYDNHAEQLQPDEEPINEVVVEVDTRPQYEVADYVALVRQTLRAVSDLDSPLPEKMMPQPVSMAPLSLLFSRTGLGVWPMSSWLHRDVYITVLQVKNQTAKPRRLDLTRIPGDWLAASTERDELSAAGQAGDSTSLFLLSTRPFSQVVDEFNEYRKTK